MQQGDVAAAIPGPLRDPVALAAPFSLLFIALQALAAVLLEDERVDAPERRRPTYGLTTPMGTTDLWRSQTHEHAPIVRDVRAAPTVRHKLGYVLGPPGRRPARPGA